MKQLLWLVAICLAAAGGYAYFTQKPLPLPIITSGRMPTLPTIKTTVTTAGQSLNQIVTDAKNKVYPDGGGVAPSARSGVYVFTCKDAAAGKTTFSDTPCGSDAVQIKVGQANVLDSSEWRQQVAERQYQRRQAANEAAARPTVSSSNNTSSEESSFDRETRIRNCLVDAAQVTSRFGKQGRNKTVASRMRAEAERRCHDDNSSSQPINESDYQVPPPPPPSTPAPAMITNCDTGGCWDTQGGRYNNGGGDTYFPTSGGACHRVGDRMQCP